jgi:hypothetical protein
VKIRGFRIELGEIETVLARRQTAGGLRRTRRGPAAYGECTTDHPKRKAADVYGTNEFRCFRCPAANAERKSGSQNASGP